jgi:hypothetical protein
MEFITKNKFRKDSIKVSYFVVLIEQINFLKIKASAPGTEALDWLFRLY